MKELKEQLDNDYKYLAESMAKNEQSGETRVNIFIGLITFIVGALFVLINEIDIDFELIRIAYLASLSILLLIGIITLFRILKRNKYTDECKIGLDNIRQHFKDIFDDDGELLYYNPIVDLEKKEEKKGWAARKFGGLSHLVAALNSVLFAGIIGSLFFPYNIEQSIISDSLLYYFLLFLDIIFIVTAFIISFIIQFEYIKKKDSEVKNEFDYNDRPTHAGGLVYRKVGDKIEYLMIHPKGNNSEWILPKGHIEKNEEHCRAAMREILEETGYVVGKVAYIDRVQFEVKGEPFDVKFYLFKMKYRKHKGEKGRDPKFFSYNEAVENSIFPEIKYSLEVADEILKNISKESSE